MIKIGDKVKFKLRQSVVRFGTKNDGSRLVEQEDLGFRESGIGIVKCSYLPKPGFWIVTPIGRDKEVTVFEDHMLKID